MYMYNDGQTKRFSITLADGRVLENLELNGNNFISDSILEDAVFEGNLGSVTISDGYEVETYTDMVLVSNRIDHGKSWFILGEKTEQQKKEETMAYKLAEMEQAMSVLLGVTEHE